MPSNSSATFAFARTVAKAGFAFVGSVAMGCVLAFLLGGGVFVFYLYQLPMPSIPAASQIFDQGAIFGIPRLPSSLIGVLLLIFVPIYLVLGIARGRNLAMQQVVMAHGEDLSQRITNVIAVHIEAMPHGEGMLERVLSALTADAICKKLESVFGTGRVVRSIVTSLVNRLPLADLMVQWQKNRVTDPTAKAGASDPLLRELLSQRISETLKDVSSSSRKPLYLAMATQAILLVVGMLVAG